MRNIDYVYPDIKPQYVGLRIEDGKAKFIFPSDYIANNVSLSDGDIKKDMLNLLKVIDKYKSLAESDDKSKSKKNFPFESLLWIIRDYMANGYYHTKEQEYIVGNNGKVNWQKTIRNNEIFLNTDNIVYRELIVKHTNNNVKNIITIIHQYIVYISTYAMGWYYNLEISKIFKPVKIMDENNMLTILKQEYNRSFTDNKKELLRHMINVLEGLDENVFNSKSYDISTNDFEYVFERLIDEYFGNVDSMFNPRCYWVIDEKEEIAGTLRPDTILIYDNKSYIIDAKYYRYGYISNKDYLPEATSIEKQITYASELEMLKKENKISYNIDNIYNIFILPSTSRNYLKYVGYAYSSWNGKEDKTYYKIHTFLVDLRSLVNGVYKDSSIQLVNMLKEELDKH